MLHFNALAPRKTDVKAIAHVRQDWLPRNSIASPQGFTLLESLIVVAIVGILSAIAVPGMLGWYSRYVMDNAVVQVQGALQEAQRQAIRSSRPCPLTIENHRIMGACLVNGNRQLPGVSLQASTTFQFNIKGAITNASRQPLPSPVTIVISSNGSTVQRCLVISTPLGFVRTGTYNGSGLNDQNCLP